MNEGFDDEHKYFEIKSIEDSDKYTRPFCTLVIRKKQETAIQEPLIDNTEFVKFEVDPKETQNTTNKELEVFNKFEEQTFKNGVVVFTDVICNKFIVREQKEQNVYETLEEFNNKFLDKLNTISTIKYKVLVKDKFIALICQKC